MSAFLTPTPALVKSTLIPAAPICFANILASRFASLSRRLSLSPLAFARSSSACRVATARARWWWSYEFRCSLYCDTLAYLQESSGRQRCQAMCEDGDRQDNVRQSDARLVANVTLELLECGGDLGLDLLDIGCLCLRSRKRNAMVSWRSRPCTSARPHDATTYHPSIPLIFRLLGDPLTLQSTRTRVDGRVDPFFVLTRLAQSHQTKVTTRIDRFGTTCEHHKSATGAKSDGPPKHRSTASARTLTLFP